MQTLKETLAALPASVRLRAYMTMVVVAVGILLITAGAVLGMRDAGRGGVDTELAGLVEPKQAKAPKAAVKPDDGPVETCWPVFGNDRGRSSSARLGIGAPGRVRWRRRMGSLMEFPPSQCDGVLYVNTADGITAAIDTKTGKPVWERKTANPAGADTRGVYDTTPAVAGDRLIVAAKDGKLQALERSSGRVLWKLEGEAAFESSPVVDGNFIYVAEQEPGRVLKVNVKNGRIAAAYRLAGKTNASPALAHGLVYITSYGGEIVALNASDLSEAWVERRTLLGVKPDPMYASPVVVNDTLYATSIGGNLYALDAKTGTERFQHSVGDWIYATAAVSKGKVFFGAFDDTVRAVDARNGTVSWSQPVDGNVSGTGVVIDDIFFVSTTAGTTYGFDARSGRQVWKFDNGKYVPGIATESGYYMTFNGMLIAFDPKRARS